MAERVIEQDAKCIEKSRNVKLRRGARILLLALEPFADIIAAFIIEISINNTCLVLSASGIAVCEFSSRAAETSAGR